MISDAGVNAGEFSWVNLVIVIVLALVLIPAVSWLRRKVSQDRRERWAGEDEAYRDSVDGRDR